MKGWVLSQEGDKWSVRFDVRDRGIWILPFVRGLATLAARFRLVISRLVFDFCSPFRFSWSSPCGQVHVFACSSPWD